MRWLAVMALLLASRADANLVYMTNFAAVDINGNSVECPETDNGSSTDAMIVPQTTVAHNTAAGGIDTFFGKPIKVDITSGGASRYFTVFKSDIDVTQLYLTMQAHDHNDVTQTGTRELLEYSMGGTRGCYLTEDTSHQLTLNYNTTGTTWGSAGSAWQMRLNACQGDPLTGCATPGADATCSSGTCGNCASTGECYWPGISVNQVNYPAQSGDQVDCQLYINGNVVLSGLKSAANLADITNVRIGAPASGETGLLRWYVGSVVVDDAAYAGHGWVGSVFPLTDATTNSAWTNDTCTTRGTAGTDSRCVRDWTGSGTYDNNGLNDSLRANAANRIEDLITDVLVPPSSTASIPAAEMVMVGRTDTNNGNATWVPSFLSCSSVSSCVAVDKTSKTCVNNLDCGPGVGTCTSGFCVGDSISGVQTTPLLISRFLSEKSGSGAKWSGAELAQLGVRYNDTVMTTYAQVRMGAMVVYVRGRKADAPLPSNLQDHNVGVKKCAADSDCGSCSTHKCEGGLCTGDCTKACYGISDSRGYGTEQSSCQGGTNDGQFCSGPTYCNNVTNAAGDVARDIVCTNDATCATCVNKRSNANNGAGYPCTSNDQCTPASCPGSGCLCSGGLCSQNDQIQCSGNSDCEGLGTCEVDPNPGTEGDFCVQSCPGGKCPDRTGWPAFIGDRVNCDVVASCSQGGERVWSMVLNRFPGLLVGKDTTCQYAKGTGQCACTGNADCGTGGACWCRNDADCGTGGNCTVATGVCAAGSLVTGVCGAGDALKIACTSSANCTNGTACVGPPGDYYPVVEDVNDAVDFNAPECREPEAIAGQADPGGICYGTTTLCTDDTACNTGLGGTVSPTSQCLGVPKSAQNFLCNGTRANSLDGSLDVSGTNGLCSVKPLGSCMQNSDCATSKCLGTLNGNTLWEQGYCGCTADADCKCQSDADCGGGVGSCTIATGACASGTLQWKCIPVDGTGTAGSSHPGQCRRKCAADSTCSSTSVSGACNVSKGVCVGRCTTPCDRNTCATDNDCPLVLGIAFGGIPVAQRGECVSGRCAHCGPQNCPQDANTHKAFARYTAALYRPDVNAVDQLTKMNQIIDLTVAAKGGTKKPIVLFGTGIEPGTEPCFIGGWRGQHYQARNAARLLANPSRYPHVIDVRRQMQERNPSTILSLFSFFVHFSASGAQVVGGDAVGNYMAALNECAQTSGAIPTVQKYCRSSAGVYQTTGGSDGHGSCVTAGVCTAGYSCTAKICASGSDCPNTTDTCFTE